ncbi:hypothetical protein GGR51DRAFT_550497 [Nemania sp. FL0031]|nr:hypothetical protein GGR51DRAFT_550497 [Nemania sp. FL0031]
MEPPAKRPRLSKDTRDDVAQSTEASQRSRTSGQPSNNFEGTGLQNAGTVQVGGNINIIVNKESNTKDQEDKCRELLGSLRFDQMDSRQYNIKKAHGHSCAWFLETPSYINWLQGDASGNSNNFLWIKGKPGAGKSTLMKFLLGQLRNQMRHAKNREVLLSFFFNARGHDLEKATIGLYRSLLLQLLEALPDLKYVLDSIRIGHDWTLESLKSVFEEAVQGLGGVSLICLIDALDECEEPQIRDMVRFLSDLSVGENQLRICFASRHYPHITIKTGLNIVLEAQIGHNEDIASYINSALIIEDNAVAEQIRDDLQKKASGVFMWVVLVVGILNEEYDAGREHSLRKRIQEIPGDLHKLFLNILNRDDKNKDGLLLCIQWVLFARRPLTPRQLYFALFSGLEPAELERRHLDDISEDTIKRYILSTSKGLAESTKSRIPTVQFIHESVRDFLLKDDGLNKVWSDLPGVSTTFAGKSHDTLKQCCLTYMNIEAAPTFNSSSFELMTLQFPLLEYANQGLLYHADQAQSHDIDQTGFLNAFSLSKWLLYRSIFPKGYASVYTSKASLLYILASANTPALIRAYPHFQSCFEVEDEQYGLPIIAASATNGSAAMQAILELEAKRLSNPPLTSLVSQLTSNLPVTYDPSKPFTFKRDSDLFHQLLEFRNEKILLVFLETEWCDIHAKGPDGRTTLISAMRKDCFSTAAPLLLDYGASISAAINIKGQTPLYAACYKGQFEIARLLLNHNANGSTTNRLGQTPLYIACSEGHFEIVRLLLDHGASTLATSRLREAPLYAACSKGHFEIVRLLLDRGANHGANVQAADNYGETPLRVASFYGQLNVAKLLVERGAEAEDRILSWMEGRQ